MATAVTPVPRPLGPGHDRSRAPGAMGYADERLFQNREADLGQAWLKPTALLAIRTPRKHGCSLELEVEYAC